MNELLKQNDLVENVQAPKRMAPPLQPAVAGVKGWLGWRINIFPQFVKIMFIYTSYHSTTGFITVRKISKILPGEQNFKI